MALTAAQVAGRKRKITSTRLASILGVNPWMSELEAWLEITETGRPPREKTDAEQEILDAGNIMEPYMADVEKRKLPEGVKMYRGLGTIQHPIYPWLSGSPDGVQISISKVQELAAAGITGRSIGADLCRRFSAGDLAGVVGGWEGKTSGLGFKNAAALWAWTEQWTDDLPPPYYRAQCDTMMMLTGAPWWKLSAFVAGRGFLSYTMHRDEEHLQNIAEVCESWWEKHVIGGEMPDPNASKGDSEALYRAFGSGDKGAEIETEKDDDLDTLVVRYAHCKTSLAWLKKTLGQHENDIRAAMGEHTKIKTAAGASVTWREQDGSLRFNKKMAADVLLSLGVRGADLEGQLDAMYKRGEPVRVLRSNLKKIQTPEGETDGQS